MINQEHLERTLDGMKFIQSVDIALNELKINGKISYEANKEVCDNFTDILTKQMQQNFLDDTQIATIAAKAYEYYCMTGIIPCNRTVLDKIMNQVFFNMFTRY